MNFISSTILLRLHLISTAYPVLGPALFFIVMMVMSVT